jgi:hypothetical protein
MSKMKIIGNGNNQYPANGGEMKVENMAVISWRRRKWRL